MDQELEVIELEINSEYHQAIKILADRKGLSVEQYLAIIMDQYLENHKISSTAQTDE